MKKIVLAAAALAVGLGVSSAFAEDAAKPEAKPMMHHHHHHHHMMMKKEEKKM